LAAGLGSLCCLAQLQSINSALTQGAFADTDLAVDQKFLGPYVIGLGWNIEGV
jgi:hypothetical protein